MEPRRSVELVLLEGGRSGRGEAPPSRARLYLVRNAIPGDLQAALEETVAAARQVRRDIEARIARALDDLLRDRAPGSGPR